MTARVTAGDIGRVLTGTCDGVDSLATVTALEAHVWRPGVAAVTLAAAVDDADACTVTIELGDAGEWLPATATAGVWRIEVEATYADGSTETFGLESFVVDAEGA
jgi:hypothetical protein